MHFLDSAFAQLAFAAKLLEYVEQGKLNVDELDQPLRIEEGSSIWVLPDRLFHSDNDLYLACSNQLSVAFGAAAITLNRCREEFEASNQVSLLARNGNPPISEDEHFAELVYQIRNAFAHDISEPHWEIRGEGRRRPYLIDHPTKHRCRAVSRGYLIIKPKGGFFDRISHHRTLALAVELPVLAAGLNRSRGSPCV
jgi:hypothetical protein